jgi:hypothetical protein
MTVTTFEPELIEIKISRRTLLLGAISGTTLVVNSCGDQTVSHSSGGLIKRNRRGYKKGTYKKG